MTNNSIAASGGPTYAQVHAMIAQRVNQQTRPRPVKLRNDEIRDTPAGFDLEAYRCVKAALDFARRELNYEAKQQPPERLNLADAVARIRSLEAALALMRDEDDAESADA